MAIINGSLEDDRINGTSLADGIFGFGGNGMIFAGWGDDWFALKGADAVSGTDRIEDFTDNSDKIVLEKRGVTGCRPGGAVGSVFA